MGEQKSPFSLKSSHGNDIGKATALKVWNRTSQPVSLAESLELFAWNLPILTENKNIFTQELTFFFFFWDAAGGQGGDPQSFTGSLKNDNFSEYKPKCKNL